MAIAVVRHVYVGPRDPNTGEAIPEPVYSHQDYPRAMYHASGENIIVNDAAELAALGDGWEDSPAKFGVETHPSAETLRANKIAALNAGDAKRGPGRPPKIAA